MARNIDTKRELAAEAALRRQRRRQERQGSNPIVRITAYKAHIIPINKNKYHKIN